MSLHLAFLTLCISLLGGCADPCEKLITRLCDDFQDEARCMEWREIASTVSSETCERSLEALEALHR